MPKFYKCNIARKLRVCTLVLSVRQTPRNNANDSFHIAQNITILIKILIFFHKIANFLI